MTTHAVAQLLRLHNLHTLSIRAATNAALSQLASLPNLHTLDLNHARISDSMLHRVGQGCSLALRYASIFLSSSVLTSPSI